MTVAVPALDRTALYDFYAHPQRVAATDLLAFTEACAPRSILEPGCGTGLYSRMLLSAFPGAQILAIDLCEERVRAARREIACPTIRFETADAEELPPGRYDLITSNATFQWFRHLPRTIARYAAMLEKGGILSFSFFGPGTYAELEGALQEAFGGEVRVTASRFAGRVDLRSALSRGYRRWTIEDRRYGREFPSVTELLRSIKYTETRGDGAGPRVPWTPRALSRLERAYLDRHGRIVATYRVFLCKATA